MGTLILAGCELAPAPESLASAEQGIVNGAVEAGFPYAAAIGDENGPTTDGFCSATLITSRLALSAAHCGAGMSADYVQNDLRVLFGQDVASYELAVGVDDWVIHPSYDPNPPVGEGRPYDVSVLVLAEEVPVAPAHIRTTSIGLPDLKNGVTSVGFGCTTWSGSEFGEKHSAALTVDTVAELFLLSVTDTNPNEANICSGDSGGGMFAPVGDSWVQVGVHSEGLAFMGGVPVVTVSGRVDAAIPWLLDQVEAAHGQRDICQVNQWYGDGLCDDGCAQSDPDCAAPPDAGTGAGGTGGSGAGGSPNTPLPEPAGDSEGCQFAAGPSPTPRLGTLAWLAALALLRRRCGMRQ